jgi:hypothetical protein
VLQAQLDTVEDEMLVIVAHCAMTQTWISLRVEEKDVLNDSTVVNSSSLGR